MKRNMRNAILLALIFSAGAWAQSKPLRDAGAGQRPDGKVLVSGTPARPVAPSFSALPLGFEENRGQTDSQVRFLARGRGYTLYLTPTDAVLALRYPTPEANGQDSEREGIFAGSTLKLRVRPDSQAVLGLHLERAAEHPQISGVEPLPGRSNYFIGNDPMRWHSDIQSYRRVRYRGVYPGIDLIYYGNAGQLETDFIIAPGANPRAIRMRVNGARSMRVDTAGDLVLETEAGEVRLHRPVMYQKAGGRRREVAGGYRLLGDGRVRFAVGSYDRTQPLILDPTIMYSTFLGGSGQQGDTITGIAVDSVGSAYVTGATSSPDFPLMNALNSTYPSGAASIPFVAKLTPGGAALVYSTFFEGTTVPLADAGNAIAVDSVGNAYVTGTTSSGNFPTVNPTQGGLGSGTYSAFLSVINASGSALLFSTYIGGINSGDQARGLGIAVNSQGTFLSIVGAMSTANPPTVNYVASNCKPQCGFAAGFRINLGLKTFNSSFLTGLGNGPFETATATTFSADGNSIYVAGNTSDATLVPNLVAAGAAPGFQPYLRGLVNGFVLNFGQNLSFRAGTYFGGSRIDGINAIAVDKTTGDVVFAGTGTSPADTGANVVGAPGCLNARAAALAQAAEEARANALFKSLTKTNFFCGNGNVSFTGVAADSGGNIHVSGYGSPAGVLDVNPLQSFSTLDPQDTVSMYGQFAVSGVPRIFTPVGGGNTGSSQFTSIAVDNTNQAYAAGTTFDPGYPLVTPFQSTLASPVSNGSVTKILSTPPPGIWVFPPGQKIGNLPFGKNSRVHSFSVTNNTGSPVTFVPPLIGGANASDVSIANNGCSGILANGVLCSVGFIVRPTATGNGNATITINGVTEPITYFVPVLSSSTDNFLFLDMTNNASSPGIITIFNNGPGAVAPTAINIVPFQFSIPQGDDSFLADRLRPATFNPAGENSTSDVAAPGQPGSGLPFAIGPATTCSTTTPIPANGGSCVVQVIFTPTATGPAIATLQITDNATPPKINIGLFGNGVPGNGTPTLVPMPPTVSFSFQAQGTASASSSFMLANTGNAPATINANGITVTGPNAADFAILNTSTCAAGSVLPSFSLTTCTLNVTFTPSTTTSESASISIASNAPSSPLLVPLSGTATTSGGTPAAAVTPPPPVSLIFGSQGKGSTSLLQSVSVANTGNGPLVFSANGITITGANATDFAVASQFTTCVAGGTLAPGTECFIAMSFTPSTTGIEMATLNIADNSPVPASPQSVGLTGIGATPASAARLTPGNVSFGFQQQGTTSGPITLTLANTGSAALNISANGITITGANAADFTIVNTSTCSAGGSVPAGSSCTVSITFKPSMTAAESATLAIADNATGSPQTDTLAGTGTAAAPAASLSPTPVNFGNQRKGTTSAPLTVTVTNAGAAALHLAATNAVTIAGANAPEFAVAAAGTTCTNGAAVNAGATCVVMLTFTPGASGSGTATLSVADDAASSPQTDTLSGTGVFPATSLNPTSVSFPATPVGSTSAAQTVTLTNSGTDTLHLTANVSLGGANTGDFTVTQGTTCISGTALAPNGTCLINFTFAPAANGNRSATATVTDDASPATQTIALTGATPQTVALSPNTLTFASQGVGTASAAQTITLTNNGGAALALAAANTVTITGTNASDFTVATGTTCTNGANVAGSGGTCVITVTFMPGAIGARGPAALTITDNANPTTQTVTLTGTGIDFTPSVTPGSATITAGQTATFTISIASSGGFASAVTFAISGLPAAATGTFSPTSVTPPGSTMLTISTTKHGVAPPAIPWNRPIQPVPLLWPLAAALALLASRATALRTFRVRQLASCLPLVLLLLGLGLALGCNGASNSGAPTGTPVGTSTITVTATSGGVTHTVPLTLTVQ